MSCKIHPDKLSQHFLLEYVQYDTLNTNRRNIIMQRICEKLFNIILENYLKISWV